MKKEDFIKIVEKHAIKKTTKQEEKVVSDFFDALQRKEMNIEDEEKVRLRILSGIREKTQKVKQTNYYRIAASVTIFICLTAFLFKATTNSNTIYYATQKGEKKNITLPDGSTVFLNSNSNITYNKDFKTNRNLVLHGEAFFNVTKDSLHPFTVKTSTIQTEVLGTSFNIHSSKHQDATVTVNTGKVQVNLLKNKSVKLFLTKNQSAVYTKVNTSLQKNNIISSNYSSWTKNTLWFNNLTLLEAAKKIENWFNVEITIKDATVENLRLTGTYKDPKLEEVLESIKFLKNIEYTVQNSKITIDKFKK